MTEQEKREKALRILEGHYSNFLLRHNGEIITMTEIIGLLKAQEPRVMTESELDAFIQSTDGEARVWIEHRKLGMYCACLWRNNPRRGDKNFYDPIKEYYLERGAIRKWWRPWTSRPSDAQKEAEPWQG